MNNDDVESMAGLDDFPIRSHEGVVVLQVEWDRVLVDKRAPFFDLQAARRESQPCARRSQRDRP